jgi:DNA-binding beta-propeller fold protein YncE
MRIIPLALIAASSLFAQPALPVHPVEDWARLPAGWNFGECSGVAVDKADNVWIFNRGPHPVVEFDKTGRFIKAFSEVPVVSAHGIRVDAEGNVWLIDVAGHKVLKMSPEGRVLLFIGGVGNAAGDNESTEAFNRPTNVAFGPNGTFFISDGYVNSRVAKFDRNGDFIMKWGSKGTGDGQFNLVHDVVLDKRGRVIVADRANDRIQVFDQDGKFLTKWDKAGTPWGLDYVAREDALYVADGKNDRVVRVNMEGQVTGTLGGHGKALGKFDFPHSIAVDSSGTIYVAEIKNWRVQKFVR